MKIAGIVIVVTALLMAALLWRPGHQKGPMKVAHAWTPATAAGQVTAGAYMLVKNTGEQSEKIIAASSPIAKRVDTHETRIEQGVTKMREVESFVIPPGGSLDLARGGPHFMFIGMKQPFRPGDRIPLVLHFDKAGPLELELTVGAAPTKGGASAQQPHH